MAAHNFIGSAAGVGTASAVWNAKEFSYVLDPKGVWQLSRSGGTFTLKRFVASAYTTDLGTGITEADMRSLWLGLSNLVG